MSSDAAFDYSDEERVTVVHPESLASAAPIHSLIISEKSSPPSSEDNKLYYTKEIEFNGKLMRFDATQLKNEEGCLKIAELVCFIFESFSMK